MSILKSIWHILVCLWKWKCHRVSFNCYFMLSQQEICFITHQVGMMFYMFRAPTTWILHWKGTLCQYRFLREIPGRISGKGNSHSQVIASSKRPRHNFYRCTIVIQETKKKQQLTHYDKLSSKTSFDKRYHMVGSLARRRKAWFHLRRNRMLFAAKHSEVTLPMSKPLLAGLVVVS